jgi:SAM-dependent methyltransferase
MTKVNFARKLWKDGKNVIEGLNQRYGKHPEHILISYDLQAGSYAEHYKDNPGPKHRFLDAISPDIFLPRKGQQFSSILEVGCGECTTMLPLRSRTNFNTWLGFDISLNRILTARDFCMKHSFMPNLFVADLFRIPLADNSIDVVYTFHSIEPNGGRENEAIEELKRVAAKRVILIEPDYYHASEEAQARMEKHGYIKLNPEGFDYTPLHDVSINPLNPSGMWVYEKNEISNLSWAYPGTNDTNVKGLHNKLFPDQGRMFHSYDNIPIFLGEGTLLT